MRFWSLEEGGSDKTQRLLQFWDDLLIFLFKDEDDEHGEDEDEENEYSYDFRIL